MDPRLDRLEQEALAELEGKMRAEGVHNASVADQILAARAILEHVRMTRHLEEKKPPVSGLGPLIMNALERGAWDPLGVRRQDVLDIFDTGIRRMEEMPVASDPDADGWAYAHQAIGFLKGMRLEVEELRW